MRATGREPNDRLRAAREATPSPRVPGAGMSRAELADAVNTWLSRYTRRHGALDEHYVSRLERGKIRWPNADYRAAFAAVLNQPESALGFRPSSVHRRPVRPLPANQPAPRCVVPEGISAPLSEYRGAEVAAIRAMSAAFQAADRQVGGGLLYGQVSRYLSREIGPLLLDTASPAGAGLFEAAASVTEVAGWMAHDGGHDTVARRHFERAYRLASAADHAALAGNVCASMSHLAGQLGQAADAVRIAEAGLGRASGHPGTTRLVARLHAMRARGLAMRGERSSSMAALTAAEDTLARVGGEVPAEWIAGFDQASFASEAAMCLRELGDLPGAERQATQVVALRNGDRVRSRAFGQLTLAVVLADSGRTDEAAALGLELCRVAESLTSARVVSRLDELGASLRPHVAVPEVGDFLACLSSLPSRHSPEASAWPV